MYRLVMVFVVVWIADKVGAIPSWMPFGPWGLIAILIFAVILGVEARNQQWDKKIDILMKRTERLG